MKENLSIFILEDEIDFYPRNQLVDILKRHNLTIAKSVPEAMRIFEGPYDLLLLDHDMQGFFEDTTHPNTGTQFVKWLVKQDPTPKPEVILHSQNPVGRAAMHALLKDHDFVVTECAFGPYYVRELRKIS